MKAQKKTGIIVASMIVIAIVASDHFFSLGLGKKATILLSPIGVVISTTGEKIGGFFGNLAHIGSLQRENKDLSDKYNAALAEIARLTEAKKENDSLRASLGFKQSSNLDLVMADVAYFDPGLKDGITVTVDDASGIEVGNVVLAEGFLVGRVEKIDGKSIKVLLITDSTSSIPATIQNKNITGIAKGVIGNGLVVEQIPQSDSVTKGDTVVTSGLGGDLPKGLIIGTVDEVQKISGSIFQSVTLQPMVEFTRLERVMIAR